MQVEIEKDVRVFDPKLGGHVRTFVLNWSDLKYPVLDGLVDRKLMGQPVIDGMLSRMHDNPFYDGWEGCSGADLIDQLLNGFKAPEFQTTAARIPGAIERRTNWNEEDGEIDIGRLVAGQDNFFLGMAERRTKAAIRVQFEYVFSATVDKEVIAAYGAWLAGLMGAMERNGFSLTVDAWIIANHMTTRDTRNDRTNLLIRVKRENEVSNFTEWSALLGPAGFRILGHAAQAIMCKRLGKTAPSSGMATLGDRNWNLEYDNQHHNIVRVSVNQRAYGRDAFPAARLTKLAVDAGLIAPTTTE